MLADLPAGVLDAVARQLRPEDVASLRLTCRDAAAAVRKLDKVPACCRLWHALRSVLRHSATHDGLRAEARRLKAAMAITDEAGMAKYFDVFVLGEGPRKRKDKSLDWMALESLDAMPGGAKADVSIETVYKNIHGRRMVEQNVRIAVPWMGHRHHSRFHTAFDLDRTLGEGAGVWVLRKVSCADVRDPAFAAYLGAVTRFLEGFAPVFAPKAVDPELVPRLRAAGVRVCNTRM